MYVVMEERVITHWSDSLEQLFKREGENFLCLFRVHEDAQRWCASWNTRLTMPAIVLGGLTGLGAVGADQILPFTGSSVLIGFCSFAVTTIQVILDRLKFAGRAEAHRQTALAYSRLHRVITFELSLPDKERLPPSKLMNMIKEESDRLSEIAPVLPTHLITQFKKQFSESTVHKPPELNGLDEIIITKDHTFAQTPSAPPPPTPRPTVRIGVTV